MIVRYLPVITVLLWLAMVLSYIFAPQFLLQSQVKFPVLLLLGILVPVCFWNLQKSGGKGFALLFFAIFLFDVGVPAYGWWYNHDLEAGLEEYLPKGIDPEMAGLMLSAGSGEERKMAAQIIFERFGVKLPYKAEDGSLSLFAPTQKNQDNYVANHDRFYRAKMSLDNLGSQQLSIMAVILLQLVLFLGMLVFLVLYDNKPEHQPEPAT